MSRSGYTEECDNEWDAIRWRGAVASSIKGKRGQAFLAEMVEALDAMPEKRLIAHDLRKGGEVCAIGSVGAKRGVEMEDLDPEDYVGIARPLVQEIEFMNDEYCPSDTPEKRWQRVRNWAVSNLKTGDAP